MIPRGRQPSCTKAVCPAAWLCQEFCLVGTSVHSLPTMGAPGRQCSQWAGHFWGDTGFWQAVTEPNTQTLPWVCSSSSDHSHKFPTLTQGKMSLLIIHLIWLKTKCSSLINGSVFTRRSRTILDVFDVMQDTGARNLVIRTWSQPQTYLALGLWANCVLSLGFLICRFQKKETSQFANTWARTSLTFLLLTSKSCEKYSCLHVPILIVKDFKPQSGNLTLTLGKRIEEFRARNHLSGAQVLSSCLRDEEYEAPKGRWAETRACVSHCCKALVQKQDSYPQPCCVYAEE